MKVLISGSSGLIGTALVRSLESSGHSVTRLARPGSSSAAEGIAWDPATGSLDARQLEGIRRGDSPVRRERRVQSLVRGAEGAYQGQQGEEYGTACEAHSPGWTVLPESLPAPRPRATTETGATNS